MDAPIRIPVAIIYPSDNGRKVQPDRVAAIAESFAEIGLRTPITVRKVVKVADGRDTDAYEIVTGRHRYEAAIKLQWREIDAFVMGGDPRDCRLWEISENLHRAELTALERSELVAEWVRLVSPDPDFGVATCNTKPGRGQGAKGGMRDAARQLDMETTEVHRAVKVDGLSAAAKAEAARLGLDDNQSAMLGAAKEDDPDKQVAALRAKAASRSVANARTKNADHKSLKDEAEEKIAALLAEHVPAEHWDALKANLYAAKCQGLAKEFGRVIGVSVFDNTRSGRAA